MRLYEKACNTIPFAQRRRDTKQDKKTKLLQFAEGILSYLLYYFTSNAQENKSRTVQHETERKYIFLTDRDELKKSLDVN